MKTRVSSVFCALAVTALTGCEGAPDVASPTLQGEVNSSSSLAAPTATVTGSGHLLRPDNSIRAFTISAVRHPDGSVSGEYQLTVAPVRLFQDVGVSPPTIALHGTVTCMSVVDNSAYIGGTVDSSRNAELVFGTNDLRGAAIELIDNGKGPAAPADEISSVAVYVPGSASTPQDYCDDPVPGTVFSIDQGNITVR